MACDLNRSEDQRQILDSASVMLDTSYPLSRLRDQGRDDISEIASFGAFALGLPETEGGAGFSLVEEALLHGLFGCHLVSTRILAGAIGARLAAELGRSDLAEGIRAGEIELSAAVRSSESLLVADNDGPGRAVVFGDRQLMLIEANGQSGDEIAGLGHGIPMRRIAPDGYGVIGDTSGAELLDTADLLICAQLVGIAEATRDLAVSYAQVRHQFGRPIGSFQAIKHHCANMAISAEVLSSQLDLAAIALRDNREDARFQIAALGLLAPKTALANARMCIQIHGGIGFSAEADAHHFLRQAHWLSRLLSGKTMLDLPAPLAPYTPFNERS